MIYNLKNLTVKNMAPNLYVDCHPSSGLDEQLQKTSSAKLLYTTAQ